MNHLPEQRPPAFLSPAPGARRLVIQMTGHHVSLLHFLRLRHVLPAALHGVGTALHEPAAVLRIHRTGDLALDRDALAGPGLLRVRHGNGREKGLRVRVQRISVERIRVRLLHDGSQVHHHDAVGNVFDHT